MAGGSEEERGFTALLESVQHELRVVAEGHADLYREIGDMRQNLVKQVSELDKKIEQSSQTLLRKMEEGFDSVRSDLRLLENRFAAHERSHAN